MLRWGIHDCLDEAYVPFFGAFGTAWDDAMIARWSANPLGMLWPEMDAAFIASSGVAAARDQAFGKVAGHRFPGAVVPGRGPPGDR